MPRPRWAGSTQNRSRYSLPINPAHHAADYNALIVQLDQTERPFDIRIAPRRRGVGVQPGQKERLFGVGQRVVYNRHEVRFKK